MNFAAMSVYYWLKADEHEQLANQAGEELKARQAGVLTSHPVRDSLLGMQRHYLRKAHAAAAIAAVCGHTLNRMDLNAIIAQHARRES